MTDVHKEGPLVRSILETIRRARLYRSCLTCIHFDETTELCAIANQRPPARVIAQGCSAFEEAPPF